MKKTEIWFPSRDGESKIHALRYEPDSMPQDGPAGILQIVHGMAEYVERYEETAEFFTDRGFVVTGEDHLGHGKTAGDGRPYGYFCKQDPATVVVRDVHRLKKMTQELYPQAPYYILGHSMGSYILRNYLCRYGKGIRGAILMGTGSQSAKELSAAKALAKLQGLSLGDSHTSELLEKLAFGHYTDHFKDERSKNAWLSANVENVKRYEQDILCGFPFTVNGFQTLFELVERAQKPENIAQIPKELPVLFVSGSEDPVGNYTEGVKRAVADMEKAGMTDIECRFYEGDRHEILNEKDGETVRRDIADWIDRHLGDSV